MGRYGSICEMVRERGLFPGPCVVFQARMMGSLVLGNVLRAF